MRYSRIIVFETVASYTHIAQTELKNDLEFRLTTVSSIDEVTCEFAKWQLRQLLV